MIFATHTHTHTHIYIYIYINRKKSEKVQLEFEIKIQFCVMCLNLCEDHIIIIYLRVFFFFFKEFQPMASTPDNHSLSSDQDTNQFLV